MSQSICSTGLRWLWLVVVVLIIDLGSKYLILQNFALGDTVPLFPSLNLHYARNYGAAFSFLADSGGWQRWFFAGIAIGISVILAVMMYRSKATQKLNNIAYALIIGGALGNLTMPPLFKFGAQKGRIVFIGVVGIFCGLTAILDTPDLSGVSLPIALLPILTMVIFAASWLRAIRFYEKREI